MGTTISSRTPEGVPNHCPVCRQVVIISPSQPPGDAPCPHCGSLLWFYPGRGEIVEPRLYESSLIKPIRERVHSLICEQLGISRDQVSDATDLEFVNDLGADSLDAVELVMELEDEFDFSIPDEAAESIHTVADAIAYLEQQRRLRRPDE